MLDAVGFADAAVLEAVGVADAVVLDAVGVADAVVNSVIVAVDPVLGLLDEPDGGIVQFLGGYTDSG